MSQLNQATEQIVVAIPATYSEGQGATVADSESEGPVLKTVFNTIVLETVKGVFSGIRGFFMRYARHFIDGFRYFWRPGLHAAPLNRKDYKENCQQSFELSLLVLFAVIFMLKMDWIPPTGKAMMEWLNNDISQMGMEALMFVLFAIAYLVLTLFSVLTGRLWRSMLKLDMPRKDSDVLYVYLNNIFFSIAAVVGLAVRCSVSLETTSQDSLGQGLLAFFLAFCLLANTVWAIRFAVVHGLGWGKGLAFFALTSVFYPLGFAIGQLIAVSILLNV